MNETAVTHVICIKWGNKYHAHDVNRLCAMVKRHSTKTVHFHCFTDNCSELRADIITHDLPAVNLQDPNDLKYVYRKEVGLCDDYLGGLHGQRVFFFDLDVIITNSLDELFEYPQEKQFVIINDWNSKGNVIGQATCYSWIVGTLGYIKEDFESRPKDVVKIYFTASQEYLSAMVIQRYGALHFWPEEWCRSFKKHALPVWFLRPFLTPSLPKNTKVLAFHGDPKIEDAIIGRWSSKKIPLIKRFYKTIRPSAWILDFWHE